MSTPKKTFSVYAFLIIILHASCSQDSTVNIQYNTKFASDHKIAIDDTIIIKKDISYNYKTLLVKKGNHSLSIDNGIPKEFSVGEKGGILNIAREDFIIYPTKFLLSKETIGETMNGIPNGLVIDSFVVGSETFFKIYGGSLTRKKVDSLSNGNNRTELIKINKSELFIPKTWDVDINQEMPKSVSGIVSESTKEATLFRTKIINAKDFLKMTQEGSSNFFAVPVSKFIE